MNEPGPTHTARHWHKAIKTGQHVQANYANGLGVHARGHVVGYQEMPTVIIRTADGDNVHWAAHLTTPDPTVPDLIGGTTRRPPLDTMDDRKAMLADLLGDNRGTLTYAEHATRVLHALYGYKNALDTGTRCDSPTVSGGCARYPDHRGGHSMYPLPGDPGYADGPVAQAMNRLAAGTTPDPAEVLPDVREIQQQRKQVMAALMNIIGDDANDPTTVLATGLMFLVAQLPSRTSVTAMLNDLAARVARNYPSEANPVD